MLAWVVWLECLAEAARPLLHFLLATYGGQLLLGTVDLQSTWPTRLEFGTADPQSTETMRLESGMVDPQSTRPTCRSLQELEVFCYQNILTGKPLYNSWNCNCVSLCPIDTWDKCLPHLLDSDLPTV